MIEVEAKIKISNPKEFRKKVRKLARYKGKTKKIDDYYTLESLKKYPRKTSIQDISHEEIKDVLSKVISNFDEANVSESLSYASKFDLKHIAQDTNKVYIECVNHAK